MQRTLPVLGAILALSCGQSSPTGPTPVTPPAGTPSTGQTFTLSGAVRDAATTEPVRSARVQFMTGVNAGRLAVTDDTGRYVLTELRAGTGTVRAYGPQHAPAERPIQIAADLQEDFAITRATVETARPPFTYTGTIWDSRGAPVAGAAVTIIRDSGANPLGIVTTGADGAFTITVQSSANVIRVSRQGYVQRENPAPPVLTGAAVANATIPRIVRYAFQPVAALRVGQTATLMTEVDTDDGLRATGRAYEATTSGDDAVVAIASLGVIVARAPGMATIAGTYSGLSATIAVQVAP